MKLRKLHQTKETIFAEAGKPTAQVVTRAVAIAVLANPFAGRFVDDLSPLFNDGAELGATVMNDLIKLLPNPAVSYGKAAIVGVDGELEHGAALIHPRLGQPIRDAVGGGQAIISSNIKIGGPGTAIDVPLAHKDNIWAFDYLDTMTVSIADAPRPNEIVAVIAISDGGRPHPRVGKGRA
ncbi:MAG TPA: amino acid synthesis family protein [Pseudolabrys sp.]|nr:amino acid synthesis family protein [Pseudolabrys sp.]